jgi:hypothetical protein
MDPVDPPGSPTRHATDRNPPWRLLSPYESRIMLQTILIVLLILFLLGGVGTLPTWSHSRNWGYAPSGGLSLIGIAILVILILLLTGRL